MHHRGQFTVIEHLLGIVPYLTRDEKAQRLMMIAPAEI